MVSHDFSWAKRVFIVGLFCCLVGVVGLSQYSYFVRDLPPEVDDAWAYITRAVLLEQCVWSECPALEDLVKISRVDTDNPGAEGARWLSGVRGVHIGPPLYPFLLMLFHQMDFSWHQSYQMVAGLGALLVVTAGGFFLSSLFGYGPAGIGLFLLAMHVFPRQGLHYLVPGNFTLGLAFLAWTAILKRAPAPLVIGLILLMVITHPVGQIYGVVTLVLYLLCVPRQLSSESFLVLVAGFSLVVLPFILPRLMERPEVFFQPLSGLPRPSELDGLLGIKWNVYGAITLIKKDFPDVIMNGLFALFSLAGLAIVPENGRRTVGLVVLLLAGLSGASLLYVFVEASAALFFRVNIPFFFILAGLVGVAGWKIGEMVLGLLQAPPFQAHWGRMGFVMVAAMGLGWAVYQHQRQGVEKILFTAESMRLRQNQQWAVEQPLGLPALLEPGDQVMYHNIDIMEFFVAHGAMRVGALLWTNLRNTGEERALVRENPRLRLVVGENPILRRQGNNPALQHIFQRGGVVLSQEATVRLSRSKEQPGLGGVMLQLQNPDAEPVGLQIVLEPSAETRTLVVPAHFQGWLPVGGFAQGWRLTLTKGADMVRLQGVRGDDEQITQWPWGRGWTLDYLPHNPREKDFSVVLDDSQLLPNTGRVTQIIDDRGSLVLALVRPIL